MIPYKDDNPQLLVPYATYTIILVNIFCWLIFQGAGYGQIFNDAICKFGLIPLKISKSVAYQSSLCLEMNNSFFLNIFTSMYMHGGWMHIIFNMLFLWVFGGNVEDTMGPFRFFIFYNIVGICASLSHVYSDIASIIPMIGASGAIGGVMGAYLILFPKVRVHIIVPLFIIFWTFRVPAYFMLGYWILLQLFEGFMQINANSSGGIAFWAHIGGFFAGCLLINIMKDKELLCDHEYYGWNKRSKAKEIWDNKKNQQK